MSRVFAQESQKDAECARRVIGEIGATPEVEVKFELGKRALSTSVHYIVSALLGGFRWFCFLSSVYGRF